jgi:ankyrin repeat protein
MKMSGRLNTILTTFILLLLHNPLCAMDFEPKKNELEEAIYANNIFDVKSLIKEKKFDLNHLNSKRMSPLMVALIWHNTDCSMNLMPIISYFIDFGAHTYLTDSQGVSILMFALYAKAKDINLIRYLMNLPCTYIGHTTKKGNDTMDLLKHYMTEYATQLNTLEKNLQENKEDELTHMYDTVDKKRVEEKLERLSTIESYLQPIAEQYKKDCAKTQKNQVQLKVLEKYLKSQCFSDVLFTF